MYSEQDSLSNFVNIGAPNYNYHQNQTQWQNNQQQKLKEKENLKYKQINDEQQALIQYYVYQDLQNLINLLYSHQAIINHFIDQPQHIVSEISRNKIILQLNISNSIHYDLQQTHQNSTELSVEKKNVLDILPSIQKEFEFDPECLRYLNMYIKNSLGNNIKINQSPLKQSNQDYNFNQNVIDKIFSQIFFVDEQINSLRQRKHYHIPSKSEIILKAKEYQKIVKNKLLINYSNNKYDFKSPQQQDQMKSQLENEKNPQQQKGLSSSLIVTSGNQNWQKQYYQHYY